MREDLEAVSTWTRGQLSRQTRLTPERGEKRILTEKDTKRLVRVLP